MKTFKVYIRVNYKTDQIWVNATDASQIKAKVLARFNKASVIKVVEVSL